MIVNGGRNPAFFYEEKMTVNSQQNKISYMGNGAAKDFTVPFSYLDKSHLTVRQMLNGVQSERTDWTVSGGTLTFETAPANNAQIVIMRQVPLTQETDYRENEILSAETLERCFDKLTMQVQQLEEKSGRAVTVDVFDDANAASLIPSIRKAVSDCAAAAASARANADTASEKAAQAVSTLSGKAPLESPVFTGTVKVPTPVSPTAADNQAASTQWVENQRLTGRGLGVPDFEHPTVLSWGVTYTAETAPQKNGWLEINFDCANLNASYLTIGGRQMVLGNVGNNVSARFFMMIPYAAKTVFSTSGASGGQVMIFYPCL